MFVLTLQVLVLALLAGAVVLCALNFPYPSPIIRPLLPAKNRWPELQIRGWLKTQKFHPGYLAFFYRDPKRTSPAGTSVLAPADGLITSAEEREGIRYVVIALSFWDVHVQRSPICGTVLAVEDHGDIYTDGEGRPFVFLREKNFPVQKRILLDTEIGAVAIRLITSVAARRIEAWVAPGDTIDRGQRIGRILLGSTVVLELPSRYAITVEKKQRVWAGETIVASPETVDT